MKRAIILLSLLLPLATQAQHSLYHQVGDTIEHRFPIYYYYNWWPDTLLHYDTSTSHTKLGIFPFHNQSASIDPEIGNESRINAYMQYSYTATPLKVIGLAAAYLKVSDNLLQETDLALHEDEYLRIYKPQGDSMILLKERLIDKTSVLDSIRCLKTEGQDDSCAFNYCCNACPYIRYFTYVPVHEYYFDDTLTITDSFYVGITCFNIGIWGIDAGYPLVALRPYLARIFDERDGIPDSCGCPAPSYWSKFRMHDNARGWWSTLENYYMMIYPIIANDTAEYFYCPPVKSVYVDTVTETYATIHWDGNGRNTEWEISYGPSGSPAGYGTIERTTDTFHTIQGLNLRPGYPYVAYVRALCHAHDSIYETEWSDRALLYNWGWDDTTAIRTGDSSPLHCTINPNPATQKVTIAASADINEVEVFDMQGRRMHSFPCKGDSLTLDISSWERGTYMLHVHTRGAVVIRKLAVQ